MFPCHHYPSVQHPDVCRASILCLSAAGVRIVFWSPASFVHFDKEVRAGVSTVVFLVGVDILLSSRI